MENISWGIKTIEDGIMLRRTDENGGVSWVPEAPGNRHYEEYLEWVAEGNSPEVIEE
jgi:hypothetical protein